MLGQRACEDRCPAGASWHGGCGEDWLEELESETTLVLCGDTPLLNPEELKDLVEDVSEEVPLAVLSAVVAKPRGYGRMIRDASQNLLAIREDRDLRNDEERAICEINAGVYIAKTDFLRRALGDINNDNEQGEFYLTDVVEFAAREARAHGRKGDPRNLMGVNDRAQLVEAEELIFEAKRLKLAQAGARISPSARVDCSVEVKADAVIGPQVVLRGATRVEGGAVVDVGTVVTDSTIGESARILPYSVITESQVGPHTQVGPFAHLRPGSVLEAEAKVGNFVETKKTRLRRGAKANHLAYLGDGDVGERANVGAGTIFCNYDGFQKHRTVVGAEAFIGSDSQIVAPVSIGERAYVATGTTVTKDVPVDALAIGRTRQENKAGYGARLRGRLAAKKKQSQ